MKTPNASPCGCAYHRGASAIIPPDCESRTPAERAAYVASLTTGIVASPPARVYVNGEPLSPARGAPAIVDLEPLPEPWLETGIVVGPSPYPYRPAHAYASGARPLRRGEV